MVAFKQAQLSGLTITNPSSLQFGPDGRLYVAQDNGVLAAVTVASDGAGGYRATAKETISLVRFIPNHNDDGTFNDAITTRQVTGILVTGTADKPIVYVSSSDPRIGGGASKGDTGLDTNSGTLSRLTKDGRGAWVKEDLVIGLPRSEENHAVNGLQLDPATGHILLTVGGQTNAGAPSQEFGYLSDYAYGASIVDIDVAAIDAMQGRTYRGQVYKYALPTLDDPTRPGSTDILSNLDPEVFGGNNGLNQARLTPDSPVQIYATGFRNLYDIAVSESGQIYGIDNGGNPTWGGPPLYRQPDGTLGTTPTGQVTNAVNDGGGSINMAPLHLIEHGYYGGHPTPIRANPTGAGLYRPDGTPVTLPADWPPVPASMVDPVNGYYLPPGVSRADILPGNLETPLNLRGELTSFAGSVNGIDDYRSDAFNGEMKGDLVAASLNDDSIYRVDLSADGKTVLGVTNLTPNGLVGDGSALDVHAAPENGPFAGTLWVASYGGGVTVLTPDNNPSDPGNSNQDTDNDGLNNIIDPFPVDATNGQSVLLEGGASLAWTFSQNEPHPGPGGIGNLGFTGVMLNGKDPYTAQYDPNKTIMGGAASGVLIQDITAGTPETNSQTDAYQFGVDIGSSVATYTISGKVNNPFDNTTPRDNQSVGFFIGTGDQNNYVRLTAGATTVNGVANTPVIAVLVESGGLVVADQTFAAPVFGGGQKSITASDAIILSLVVDTAAGTVTPKWTVSRGSTQADAGDLFTGTGTAIAVDGDLLDAVRGDHVLATPLGDTVNAGLAVGIIATSEGPGAPFPATFNSINISSTAKPNLDTNAAELVFTPGGGINADTYNANSIQLSNLGESGGDLKQVVINLSDAILPDSTFFDTSGASGTSGKTFHIDSRSGTFTAIASYQDGSAATGYRQMTLDFTDFNPGETVGFSLDIEPDSLIGVKQASLAAALSGAELTGSHVTFQFADGSTTEADLFGSGAGQAEARGYMSLHAAPRVSLQSMTSGNITFPAGDPSISVQGLPGSTIRVEMMAVAQQAGPFSSPFDGNNATSVVYETLTLDAGGFGSVSASLIQDQVLVVAAAEINAQGNAISSVSPELRIIQQSSIPPATIVGTANGETLTGTAGEDSLDAKGGDDTLNGLSGNDYLDGGTGSDRMNGGSGDDVYVVDAAGDVVVENSDSGNDTVRTSLSTYVLPPEVENLIAFGTTSITGTGNGLANRLTGTNGNDRLNGLGGADTLIGGLGNDVYVVGSASDTVIEAANQGTDRVISQVSYVLGDNVETLQLSTGAKINATGNSIANTLLGNAAANILDGRAGADTLMGGEGDDTFIFRRGEANGDTVGDFAGAGVAGGDRITFMGYGADATLTRVGNTDSYVIYAGAAYDGLLETIRLTGVNNLNAADYTFAHPENQAPSSLLLSSQSVLESATVNTVVGTFSGVDPDDPEAFTFTLLNDAGGHFKVSGSNLVTAAPLDFETTSSYVIMAQIRDTAGNTLDQAFTISVTDVRQGDVFQGTLGNDIFTYGPLLTYDHVDGLSGTDTLGLSSPTILSSSTGAGVMFALNGDNLGDFFASNVEALHLSGGTIRFGSSLAGTATKQITMNGTANADVLDGTLAGIGLSAAGAAGADKLTGGGLADQLDGGAGNDRLDGLAGADTMIGGTGNDTFVVDNADDVIVELVNQGADRVLAKASYALPDNLETLQLTTSTSINGTGNSLKNMLVGNGGANILDGRGDADILTGGGGNDTFVFRRGEANGDQISDFSGAGVVGGDQIQFVGYGAAATLTHVGSSDTYVIQGSAGITETIQLTGVNNLSSGDWQFI